MKGIPENIMTVLGRLLAAGFEAYIVGGCVRDLAMGRRPEDFDVCTSALPEETERVFAGEKVVEDEGWEAIPEKAKNAEVSSKQLQRSLREAIPEKAKDAEGE